ncbi:unnamed protein product [Phytophthora fragariaefolia]|uniref:ATP-dependent DNA helicase n=1 Tax=Phytophthora fragariaefolia TaxID=1490495 RepID=A0A9W6Y929_9STRA|nr:unnamed protein product [Phytophthora fragariaefolia]
MTLSASQVKTNTGDGSCNYGFIPTNDMTKNFAKIAANINKMQTNTQASFPSNRDGHEINDSLIGTSHTSVKSSLPRGQQQVVDWILTHADTCKQTLTVIQGGAGTGKSFLMREIVEYLKDRGLKVISTCPTGAWASQLTAGQTFHSAFKTRSGIHLARNTLEKMREQFDDSVGLVLVDEISMFSAEFLVLLDRRLRALYDPNQMFGGISISLVRYITTKFSKCNTLTLYMYYPLLQVGDFLKLIVLMGTPICKAMYENSNNETIIQARILFSSFKVFFLEQQQRARSCNRQQQNVHHCQELPTQYPRGQRWTKNDIANFHPISDEVIDSLTTPLTNLNVIQDPAWLDETTILVTSNADKAALTASATELFAKRHHVVACRWKKTNPRR